MKLRQVGGIIAVVLIGTGCPPPCGGAGQDCCDFSECGAGLTCAPLTRMCEVAEPLFPADYQSQFTMVRDCRLSIEHDLQYIRIWANDTARDPYLSRTGALPTGSLLVKEEFSEDTCTELAGWSVMHREEGYFPEAGDWHWQSLAFDRTVVEDGPIFECFSCHEDCVPPDGFDWTCAVP